ncbi:MAG TPA: LysR family substrate-binding domain-containing protein [Pseudonocardiaceae bacterium]|nr:LysR family substrate-binding domain-containing protein [Pseudonocardiaceae bacterium]
MKSLPRLTFSHVSNSARTPCVGDRQVGGVVAQRQPQRGRLDRGAAADALRGGRADVAFVWLPADLTDLHAELVHTEPRVVGLPAGHSLAGRDGISVPEVNDEPLMWTERAPRAWVDWWAVNPRPDGSAPHWEPLNDDVEEMLEKVAEGTAICFAASSMARFYARPDLVWVPLTDVPPLRVVLAWLAGADTDLIRDFADVVRELAVRTGPVTDGPRSPGSR